MNQSRSIRETPGEERGGGEVGASGPNPERDHAGFLSGGGEMGKLIAAKDWSKTPLGPIESWPQSLRTAVGMMLDSRYPMFIAWGPQLTFLYNDGYRPIFGAKHPHALGQPFAEIWAEIWDDLLPLVNRALGGEATWSENLLLFMERCGYPEEVYFTFSYSPIRDESGVGGMFCACTETTEHVIGERRLALLRDLAAGAADVRTWREACLHSAAVLGSNDRDLPFALLYTAEPGSDDLTLAGTTGLSTGHVAAPASAAPTDEQPWPLGAVVASQEMQVVDVAPIHGRLPTGSWEAPPARVALVPIGGGGASGSAGVLVVGLNPHRPFDDAYCNFLKLVGAQIAASIASARAHEEERRRAEALAELDRAKTAFFSNVSHEFRTPLTLMLGPVEEMLRESSSTLPLSAKSQLELVHRSSLRLLRLVNTMLDFSRIEAGRIRASYEPVDLPAYTAELASVFRSACERAGLRLVVECEDLPEPAYVDRDMWEKIVLNLLSNAFKFTLEGQIEVRLEAVTPGAGERPRARLTIRDTGVGIPAEELPRIFDRFHRVHESRGRTHEGTGIGLALVQELVKLHGGEVHVESALDEGSRFTVTIPLGKAHLDPARIGQPVDLAPRAAGAGAFVEEALRWLPEEGNGRDGEAPWARGGTASLDAGALRPRPQEGDRPVVLWADDNADMLEYVARLLSERFDVHAVSDGEAALAAARRMVDQGAPPDVILSDVMMPRTDGFGLLQALRQDRRLRAIPVILLSARAGEEARIEGATAGADDYLVKPFSARELLARVDAQVRTARLRRAAARSVRESEERFRSVFDQQFQFMALLDPDGRVLDVNELPLKATGVRRAEVIGRLFWETPWWKDLPEMRRGWPERLAAAAGADGPVVTEDHFQTADGSVRVADAAITAVRDAEGEVSFFIVQAHDITERKRSEEALRESEGRFRSMADNLPLLVWLHDAEGRQEFVNETFCSYFGVTREEMRDGRWRELVRPEDAPEYEREFMACLEAQRPFHAEVRVRRADGQWRWLESWAQPRFGPGGRFLGMIGTSADVTDRKLSEAAVRESERRFRLMADAAPVLIWISNTDKYCTWFNKPWLDFTGRPLEKEVGSGWADHVHPDDYHRCLETYVTNFDARRPFTMQYRLRRHDGVWRWVLDSGIPLYDGEGEFAGYIGSCIDITEHRRAQERAERLAEERRLVTDALPALVSYLDADGRYSFANKAYTDWFGLSSEQVIGRHLSEVLGEETFKLVEPHVRSALAGRRARYEMEAPYKHGGTRYIQAEYVPDVRPDGSVAGFYALVTDLTARKRAEQGMAQRAAEQAALFKLTDRLSRAESMEDVYEAALDSIHSAIGCDRASILLFDESKLMRFVAWRGLSDAYRRAADGHSPWVIDERDPRPVLMSDAWQEELAEPLLEVIRREGVRALGFIPLMEGGRLLGKFMIYYDQPHEFSEGEVNLALTIARQLAFAVERKRAESERRHAEEALRESEGRLNAVIQTAVDGIITIDERGTIESLNPAAVQLFGYEPEELIGRNVRVLMPAPYRDEHDGYLNNYLRTGQRKIIGSGREVVGRRKDGSTFPLELAVSETKLDGMGGPRRVFTGMVRDVTGRKQAEEALRESEARFRTLANAMPQVVWTAEPDGTVDYYNARAAELAGIALDEQSGRWEWAPCLHPEDLGPTAEAWAEAMRSGEEYRIEHRVRVKTGETEEHRWYLSRAVPVRDAAGDVVKWYGTATDIHATKQAEEALRESEERFRTLADNMSQFAWMTDPSGWIFWYNKRWYEYTGATLEQMQGWGWTKVHHPDHVDRVVERFQQALDAGEPWEDTFPLRRRDGEYRWFLSRAVPIRDRRGRIVRWFGTNTDVTERLEVERALRESEHRFKTMADTAPAMLWVTEQGRQCTFLSRGWYEYTGQSTHEGLGMGWAGAVHPEDRERALRDFADAAERGEPFAIDFRLRRADGAYRWVIDAGRPRLGDSGELLGYIGSVIDVHERKEAEEALRRSEAALRQSRDRLRAAQQIGGVGTFDWDIQRGVIHWTPELEHLYGVQRGSFGGTYEAWMALVHPEDLEEAEAKIREALRTGDLDAEWRVRLPGEEVRWLEVRGWVEHDEHGQPVRMLGVKVDVTERREHEEQMRVVMAELNHRVKNTLAVIQSIARQTIRRSPDLPVFQRSFEDRLQSIAAAHGLLTRTDWQGASLGDIVNSEVEARAATQQQCSVSGPAVLLRPKAALAMHMVVHELTTNAVKYGGLRSEQGRIKIDWRLTGSPGSELLILDWIETCTSPVSEPTERGFGSRLVEQLVEYELNGEVERHFRPAGLHCRISFPLSSTGAAGFEEERRPTASLERPRVLVVEDSLPLALSMSEDLEELGYSVVGPAGTLPRALRLVERETPAAAVLDVHLGEEKVYPLARQLRAAGVPVVLVTGYESADLPEDLRDVPLLAKPISAATVREFLRQSIRAHNGDDGADLQVRRGRAPVWPPIRRG